MIKKICSIIFFCAIILGGIFLVDKVGGIEDALYYLGFVDKYKDVKVTNNYFAMAELPYLSEGFLRVYMYKNDSTYSYIIEEGITVSWGSTEYKTKIIGAQSGLSLNDFILSMKGIESFNRAIIVFPEKPIEDRYIEESSMFIDMLENMDKKTYNFLFGT